MITVVNQPSTNQKVIGGQKLWQQRKQQTRQ